MRSWKHLIERELKSPIAQRDINIKNLDSLRNLVPDSSQKSTKETKI